MSMGQLIVQITLFGLSFWLGLYLVARDPRRTLLWLAGFALVAWSGAVALHMLNHLTFAEQWRRLEHFFIVLSTLGMLAVIVSLSSGYAAWAHRWQTQKGPMIMTWMGLMGISVSIGLFIYSGSLFLQTVYLSIWGASLMLVGTAVAIIHASDQGEAWLPHFLRSFDYAFFTAVLFAGQVTLIIIYAGGITFPMLLLLLGTVTAAIVIQVFSDPAQTALDQIAFFQAPLIRHKRSRLRAESSALQLLDTSLDVLGMDEETFARHTRRALSHMGDLPKLAANPLTNLPIIAARLEVGDRAEAASGSINSTLLRAQELKQILAESIERLKPPGSAAFGTTDAWRHYNALYFPYVVGLRPYSRRYFHEENEAGQIAVPEALAWFRAQVPERTLHNWQNTAAQLVARDLRERSRRETVIRKT